MVRGKELPLVAICGRANVGKSTLYNRLTGKHRAIIHSQEGITRDRQYGVAVHNDREFRVVDTGGIVVSPADSVVRQMQSQARRALEEARAVVFVVDGQAALTQTDFEFRDELFRLGKPVALAVNKLDNPVLEENKTDFYELGIGEPHAISATHGTGISDLLDAVTAHLPEPVELECADGDEEGEVEARPVRVAIIGKPNVGKSSLVNALMNEERVIVDETPGTTRDALDIEFRWKEKEYLLIDTAGMRRKAGVKAGVEQFSVARSLRAVRRADVCLVLVDATEGIAEQDKRILGYVVEQGRGCVVVWTKWDLIENREEKFKALREEFEFKMPQFSFVPFVTVSNVTRTRIFKVFEYVDRVAAAREKRVPTAEMNRFVERLRDAHKPPGRSGQYAKIRYATQAGVKPTTFVFFVNQRRLFHFSYVRYIENRLRETYGFEGVPIRLELREGRPKP